MNKNSMQKETYQHISNNLYTLELDVENGKILNRKAKSINSRGYLQLQLAGKKVVQHQVFAVARWGEACVGMTVNHINEIKTDNSWNNLELLTHADNISVRTFTTSGRLKKPVKAINLDTGEETVFDSYQEAGRLLNLSINSIQKVLQGKRNRTGRYTFKRVAS
jgi:hypothetical protein